MQKQHTKEFGVYHWDTFDNETLLLDEFSSLKQAQEYVAEKYKGRISATGADQIDIINKAGDLLESYNVY